MTPPRRAPRRAPRAAHTPDPYDLYERAAQAPHDIVRFLLAVHGRSPRTLAEDFCGSGAVARAWAALSPRHHAVCVDKDPAALRALRARADPDALQRLTIRRADVRTARDPADVLAALNFPIGYFHDRTSLLRYLAHARTRLKPRGVMVVDLYGGPTALRPATFEQPLPGKLLYVWEQVHIDPLTNLVKNAMHFRLPDGRWLRDAFTYHWRLWSIPELRDAFRDAGFRAVDVYASLADAVDDQGRAHVIPCEDPDELSDHFLVHLAARR